MEKKTPLFCVIVIISGKEKHMFWLQAIIEVKNLAANCKVSKEDRLRFIRDLDSNKDVSFGVLINLDGGFPDKEKDYKFHIRLKNLIVVLLLVSKQKLM